MKTVSIFDLDDTLLVTPSFGDFAKKDSDGVVDLNNYKELDQYDSQFIEVLKKIKNFFYAMYFKDIYYVVVGDFIVIHETKTGKPLSVDYAQKIQELTPNKLSMHGVNGYSLKDLQRSVGEEDNHLVITNISGFHENPSTIGRDTNDPVLNDYMKATNRMIVTGRNEELRQSVAKRLFDLKMPFPNFGLFMYVNKIPKKKDSKNKDTQVESITVKQFKVNTILKSIEDNAWEEVHFYEDRKDWLQAVQMAVAEKFPGVKFHAHLIPQTRKLE